MSAIFPVNHRGPVEFSEQGQVYNARIITERATGRSRRFVEVAEEDAERIIEMNGSELDGRKLVINEAKPRPEY